MVAGPATGVGGRVRRRDLVEAGTGTFNFVEEPPIEVPYKGIRKLIGDRMLASLQDHAQLTLNASADATSIMKFRKHIKSVAEDSGLPNITFNDMISAVVAWTLPEFPELNALFDKSSGKVVQYKQVNLAMAVDTERGLMVPVINNAHTMALSEISRSIADLAGQCRQGSIDPDLLSGGTFTITNLGSLGIESFTPVLNSPQVAILGVCSIEQKPVPDSEKGFRFQPTMGYLILPVKGF
ncbi:MAG: 2-oxo acid dehydrogenase subunit E2 [Planctomycetota bacterium]